MSSKTEKLLKANLWISKYLVFSFPFIVWVCIWALNLTSGGQQYVEPKTLLWEVLSWNFLVWFVFLVYFIVSLVCWRAFREKILTALTFSKERDERESFISGRASKATFYSTLALLILLFFLSGLNVQIYKKPNENAIDGKRGMLTIGYGFNFINNVDKTTETKPDGQNFYQNQGEKILSIDGIPFTQESLLLFVILYHIASYHLFTRKRFEE